MHLHSVSDPYTEIPAGILLLTICTPFIIEHFSIQTTVVSLLRCWFTCVGWALGLTDFLLLKNQRTTLVRNKKMVNQEGRTEP